MNKCIGCGATLQCEDKNQVGYVDNMYKLMCERCFRIQHYNEYEKAPENEKSIADILKDINDSQDLVLLVIDVLNMGRNLDFINQCVNNDIIVVLNKRDVVPTSISDEKLLEYVNNLITRYIDKIVISSRNGYNLDQLYQKILTNKKSKNVYIVGYTNVGKSSLLNHMISRYSDNNLNITTSSLPATTIYNIEVDLNENITLIDTPGIIDEGNIANQVDFEMMKKIQPKKTIKPYVHQAKVNQFLIVENIMVIEACDKTNLTFFMSNQLKVLKKYKKPNFSNMVNYSVDAKNGTDIVIPGLGFIKVSIDAKMVISIVNGVDIFIRKSLI